MYLSAWKIPLLCPVQYVALYRICHSVVRSSAWAQVPATLTDPIGEGMINEAPFPAQSRFSCLYQCMQSPSSVVRDSGTAQGAAAGGGCLAGEAALFSSQPRALFMILRRQEPVLEGKHYPLSVLLSVFVSCSLGLLKSFLQYLYLGK